MHLCLLAIHETYVRRPQSFANGAVQRKIRFAWEVPWKFPKVRQSRRVYFLCMLLLKFLSGYDESKNTLIRPDIREQLEGRGKKTEYSMKYIAKKLKLLFRRNHQWLIPSIKLAHNMNTVPSTLSALFSKTASIFESSLWWNTVQLLKTPNINCRSGIYSTSFIYSASVEPRKKAIIEN